MMREKLIGLLILAALLLPSSLQAQQKFEQMSLDRWAKLREVERYQLNIADKYYKEGKYKIALTEYEKYLALYERSEAAPYSQFKWSLCLTHLRRQNTAIKEGFQSVIDYWPDSADAAKASYLIGKTYVAIGRIPSGKKAYQRTIVDYPKDPVAVYSLMGLAEISQREKDEKSLIKIWKRLAFDIPRNKAVSGTCASAATSLTKYYFAKGMFEDALKSLETNYKKEQLAYYVYVYVRSPIGTLVGTDETKTQGLKLADRTIAYLKADFLTDYSTPELKAAAATQWYRMIEVEAYARRDDKVLAAYTAMLKIFGTSDDILGRLADYHAAKQRYAQARAIYLRFKDKIQGLSRVAASYRSEKKTAEAIKIYQQLVGLDAEKAASWQGAQGATYREVGKYPEAIKVYQVLVRTDAVNIQQWLWALATTQRDAGLLKEAIGAFRQCENFPENYKQMASCHLALKQHKEALIHYAQILKGHEGSAPWAQLQIGYTYEKMKSTEAAIKAFQLCCKKYPKASYASQAHAHLQTKYKISVTLGGATDDE